jgi:hypothetical protein
MAAIEAIVFAAAAGFAVVVLVVITVIIGIRQEERDWTLNSGKAPTLPAQIARIVLGCEVSQRYGGRRYRRDKVGNGSGSRY